MSGKIGAELQLDGIGADSMSGFTMGDLEAGGSSLSLESILSKPDAAGMKSEGGLFNMKGGMGSTLQGISAIAGAAAGIYDAYNKKKYQDKVFKMEENRVNREVARQDKQQSAYDKVFG